MKQRGAIGRIGGYAEEVAAALRRRSEKRQPRVRVRIGNAEPRVLSDSSAEGARFQTLCQEIVDAERSTPGA